MIFASHRKTIAGISYPENSYYSQSTQLPSSRSALQGTISVEVAIIGGGYTGLSAGLHLAERGVRVAVLESHRIGWGASGRNGGQIHSGQRQDPQWFEKRFGLKRAQEYFHLGEAGKQLVFDLIHKHKIQCDLKSGLIHAAHKKRFVKEFQNHAAHMERYYHHKLEWLDASETTKRLGTDVYFGALYDISGGHLHPLKFALGLGVAAENAGCQIYETTKVVKITTKDKIVLETDQGGQVIADNALLCTNGYLSGLEPITEAHVMPINNYIAATRPLTQDEIPILYDECASDSRFVINYWRMSADKRLLFGGGENYSGRFPNDIANFVRKPLSKVYPQLKDIRIDYAWGGILGVTVHRVPFVGQPKPNIWVAAGYSGQGVTIAPLMGQILAEAVQGDPERYHAFYDMRVPAFPGGKWLRYPTFVAALSWFAMRDRL